MDGRGYSEYIVQAASPCNNGLIRILAVRPMVGGMVRVSVKRIRLRMALTAGAVADDKEAPFLVSYPSALSTWESWMMLAERFRSLRPGSLLKL